MYLIYTKENCGYCRNIKLVFDRIGQDYMELKLGKDFSKEQFIQKFGYGTNFPRVLKDGRCLGGCNETITYLRNEGLV